MSTISLTRQSWLAGCSLPFPCFRALVTDPLLTMCETQQSFQFFAPLANRALVPQVTSKGVLTPRRNDVPNPLNVQGDILYLFSKVVEAFLFFRISDVDEFKRALASFDPTSGETVLQNLCTIRSAKLSGSSKMVPLVQKQIAFSRAGLNLLGLTENIGDEYFDKFCMRDNKSHLGDHEQWDKVFDKPNSNPVHGSANVDEGAIHGVVSIATSDDEECSRAIAAFKMEFEGSINPDDITVIRGKARPGIHRGHEHFGYMDGISQPAIRGLIAAKPGQVQVDPGVIVIGYEGDPMLAKRPKWAKDGTFMVFRKLQQLVPEFRKYLDDNGPRWKEFVPSIGKSEELTAEQGAELFGARLVGRWPSGAPLALAPVFDDPELGKDPNRNDNFDYSVPGIAGPTDMYCPFNAHIRKTGPRCLDPFLTKKFLESGSIIRAGITFGDEVSDEEKQTQTSNPDPDHWRGLLFVCYQSDLSAGYIRQTVQYANNVYFPTTSLFPKVHGLDCIIGSDTSASHTATNTKHGTEDPSMGCPSGARALAGETSQQFLINSRGGEYFFVPSMSTLRILAGDEEQQSELGHPSRGCCIS